MFRYHLSSMKEIREELHALICHVMVYTERGRRNLTKEEQKEFADFLAHWKEFYKIFSNYQQRIKEKDILQRKK